jgi:hypothetical protein
MIFAAKKAAPADRAATAKFQTMEGRAKFFSS